MQVQLAKIVISFLLKLLHLNKFTIEITPLLSLLSILMNFLLEWVISQIFNAQDFYLLEIIVKSQQWFFVYDLFLLFLPVFNYQVLFTNLMSQFLCSEAVTHPLTGPLSYYLSQLYLLPYFGFLSPNCNEVSEDDQLNITGF